VSDFSVQLISKTIPINLDTTNAVDPTDFREIGDITKAFFLPACYPHHSAAYGRTTGATFNSLRNGSAQAQIAATDTITLSDGVTTAIARDNGTHVWLLEYTGPANGANEVVVRGPTAGADFTITIAAAATTADSATITGIGTFAKCVPVCTAWSDGNTNAYGAGLFTLDLVDTGGGVYKVRATRSGTSGSVNIRGRVLEFRGGNWGVQRVSHSFTAGGTDENDTITSVGANTSHSFVMSTLNTGSTATQPAQATHYAYLSSTTNLRQRLQVKPTGSVTSITYVITNPLLSVAKYGTPDGTAELTGNGAGAPQTHNVTVTAVPDLTQAMVIGMAGSMSTATTACQAAFSAFDLSTTTNVRILKSEDLGNLEYVLHVLDWSGVASTRIDQVSAITEGSSFTITGLFNAGTPTVTLGGDAVNVTSNNATTITCDGAIGTKKYDVPYPLLVIDGAGGTGAATASVAPASGTKYQNLLAPLVSPSLRLTALPDLTGVEQIRWKAADVTGTSMDDDDVGVLPNGVIFRHPAVTSAKFSANAGDGQGWGTAGTQTFQQVVVQAPVLISPVPNILCLLLLPQQVNVAQYATGWTSLTLIGTLPTGLSHSDGIITGTPTQAGVFPLTVRYTNSAGNTDSLFYLEALLVGTLGVRNQVTTGRALRPRQIR